MRLPTVLTTLMLAALPVAAPNAATGTTPFDALADGSIVVPVMIAGTGPYRFVIDTGSSRTVISTRLQQDLRAPVVASTVMLTPTGSEHASVVILNRIAIAGQPESGVAAAVMPADRYANGEQVDGLIGQDVLAGLVYTLDYRERIICWHTAGESLPGARLSMTVRDHRLLVSLPQQDDDPNPLELIPDSGSDGLVLFSHARDKVRLTLGDVGTLTSLTGSRLAHRATIDRLMIGSARLDHTDAIVIDNGARTGEMGDGLLPLHMFSRVTFNAREGYLIVEM